MAELAPVGRGRLVTTVVWLALAGACLLLLATPFAAIESHGLAGRGAWFAVFLAIACLVGAGVAALGAPIAGSLAAVMFMGGIAELWMTEPDWFSAVSFAPRARVDLAMLALMGLEALVAAGALWRFAGIARAHDFVLRLGALRLAILLALLTLTAVSLFRYLFSHNIDGYFVKLVVVGSLTGVHFAMLAALLAAPDLPRLAAVVARALPVRFGVPAAIVTLLISAATALLAFHGFGGVEDETAYLFQARTFAAGLLMAPPLPPGLAPALDFYLLDADTAGWFATTPPGWPAVLALGVLAGAPWLVNPVLGALFVFLAHRLVERCADRWIANCVAVLMASSPWLLATSATLMTHALSGAIIAGGWLCVVIARDRLLAGHKGAAIGLALLAGLLMGWLFLTRALEGVLIGGLTGLWLVWTLRLRGWPYNWLVIGAYGLGCIATGALLFPYNAFFTGDPLVMPLTAYINDLWGTGGNDFGFGPAIGPPEGWRNLDLWPGHSLIEGVINTVSGLPSLTKELFGWPVGSLILILALLLWGRLTPFARAMAVVAALVIGIHVFYWFNAVFYVGPRYWYAAALPLFVLSAYGARAVIERLETLGIASAAPRVLAAIGLLAVFATAIFLPWRGIEKYSQRVAVTNAVATWTSPADMRDTLVFLDPETFGDAAILLDPLLRSGAPVFAQDLGPEQNARTAAAFPGRRVVLADCRLPEAQTLAFCPPLGEDQGEGRVSEDGGKGQ